MTTALGKSELAEPTGRGRNVDLKGFNFRFSGRRVRVRQL
jgi:hypothetical protein